MMARRTAPRQMESHDPTEGIWFDAMYVLATRVEIRLPQSTSLKDKRRVVSHILARCQNLYGVSGSETDHQDKYQHAELGFAVVASSVTTAEETIGSVEDHVWSNPELEVVEVERYWLEIDH